MDQSKEIINEFSGVANEFIGLLSLFTQEQLNKVPFEGSWTAAQVGRHIYKMCEFIPETLANNVKETNRNPAEKLGPLKEAFLNFTIKFESPDFIRPENKTYKKEELIDALKTKVQQIIATAEPEDLTLTCMSFELPGADHLTRFEAIGFAAVHTQRHIRQLQKIYEIVSLPLDVNN